LILHRLLTVKRCPSFQVLHVGWLCVVMDRLCSGW